MKSGQGGVWGGVGGAGRLGLGKGGDGAAGVGGGWWGRRRPGGGGDERRAGLNSHSPQALRCIDRKNLKRKEG